MIILFEQQKLIRFDSNQDEMFTEELRFLFRFVLKNICFQIWQIHYQSFFLFDWWMIFSLLSCRRHRFDDNNWNKKPQKTKPNQKKNSNRILCLFVVVCWLWWSTRKQQIFILKKKLVQIEQNKKNQRVFVVDVVCFQGKDVF